MKRLIFLMMALLMTINLFAEELPKTANIKCGPWVVGVTENEMTLVWTSTSRCMGWVEVAPDDFYSQYNLRSDATIHELLKTRSNNFTRGLMTQPVMFQSIIPLWESDDNGKLVSFSKARGRKAALDTLLKKYEELTLDHETVFIAHGDCLEDAQALEKVFKEKYGVKKVHIGYVGGVIGAHTGPGVLAIFFMGSKR